MNLEDVNVDQLWQAVDSLLHQQPFTEQSFYTNNFLHAPPIPNKFLPVVVYTDILLHQPFSLTTLYTNNLLR